MSISTITSQNALSSSQFNTSNNNSVSTSREGGRDGYDIRNVEDLVRVSTLSREDVQADIEQDAKNQSVETRDFRSVTGAEIETTARQLFADGKITQGEFILQEFEKLRPQISQQVESLFGGSPLGSYQQGQRFDLLQALEDRVANTENESDRAELNTLIDRLESSNGAVGDIFNRDVDTQV